MHYWKSIGTPPKNITTAVGKDVSTISREIKRNSYCYKQADAKAIERPKNASSSPKKLTPANVAVIEEKLLNDWSPEQISGRLDVDGGIKTRKYGAALCQNLEHIADII